MWSTVALNINSSKTTIVPFTKRSSLPELRTLTLSGREAKYLGLNLDSTLRWKQYVDLTMVKVTKAHHGVCSLGRQILGLQANDYQVNEHHDREIDCNIWSGDLTLESISDFVSTSAIETAKTCLLLRIRWNAYMPELVVMPKLTPLHLVINETAEYTKF